MVTAVENDRYTYRVTWSEEDGEYAGLCAEFPSLSWLADTPEVALQGEFMGIPPPRASRLTYRRSSLPVSPVAGRWKPVR